MNISILFVFICIIALIVYTKHLDKYKPTFAFAQKGGGSGPRRSGSGGRGRTGTSGKGPSAGGVTSSGKGPQGGGGDCGLPVKNIEDLNNIFNVIGFKFKSGGNIGQAPPPQQVLNKPPVNVGQGPQVSNKNGLPPMPGSNNNNIDEILKQVLQKK